ncbi:hypothetical protein C8R42DRAFT_329273 [Lentinula raphanica]|nr:hypothetical protein C8R42DRAFT_329273 [Lentinula raphanica]
MLPIPFDLHLSTSRVCCAVLLAACLFDTFVFARPLEPRESTITDNFRIKVSYDSNNMGRKLCLKSTEVDDICTPYLSSPFELTSMESFHLGKMNFASKDERKYTFDLLQQNLTDSKERNPWRSMDVAMKNVSSSYTHPDLDTPTVPDDTMENWERLLFKNTPTNIIVKEYGIARAENLVLSISDESVPFVADESRLYGSFRTAFYGVVHFRNKEVMDEAVKRVRDLASKPSGEIPGAVSKEETQKLEVMKADSPWIRVNKAMEFLSKSDAGFNFLKDTKMMTPETLETWKTALTEGVAASVPRTSTSSAEDAQSNIKVAETAGSGGRGSGGRREIEGREGRGRGGRRGRGNF